MSEQAPGDGLTEQSVKSEEVTGQSVKDVATDAPKLGDRSDAKPKREKRSKNAPAQGGAPAQPAQQLTATTTEAPRVELVELPDLPSFSESERAVIRLVLVERRDPHDVARMLNEAQNTEAWRVEGVGEVLTSARMKMLKAGEIEAARPSAYVVDERRRVYDGLILELRGELDRLPASAMFAPARAKIMKLILDAQRTRDDALQALAPLPGTLPSGAALVYVSRLRSEPGAPPR